MNLYSHDLWRSHPFGTGRGIESQKDGWALALIAQALGVKTPEGFSSLYDPRAKARGYCPCENSM